MKKRKKKLEENTKFINIFLKDNVNIFVKKNLSNYISDAIRITHYYGNLRIKYVGFNFTLLAFFASILTIFSSLLVYFSSISLLRVLPLLFGLGVYTIIFIYVLMRKYNTITFHHSDLQHYSCVMKDKDYPNIKQEHLDNFNKLIRNYSIRDDLKTLILQYLYQANYQKVGKKIRKCLIFGIIDLIITIFLSVIFLNIC